MEWSKLKNIVLIILLLTNLCLLGFVVRQELGERRAQQDTLTNTLGFLARRGVQVSREQVPRTDDLLPMTVERDLAAENEAAAALLAGPVETEARGGGVYRYYNANGSIQFHSDGAFSAEFSGSLFPLKDDITRTCLDALVCLDFQGERLDVREDRLVFRQLWQDYPLFSQQVTLVSDGWQLTAMTGGRRLMGTPAPDSSRSPISESTALIRFLNELSALGDVCSRIETITQGYASSTSLTGPMTLNPVWRITTDTGIYQMDLLTGSLSRVS